MFTATLLAPIHLLMLCVWMCLAKEDPNPGPCDPGSRKTVKCTEEPSDVLALPTCEVVCGNGDSPEFEDDKKRVGDFQFVNKLLNPCVDYYHVTHTKAEWLDKCAYHIKTLRGSVEWVNGAMWHISNHQMREYCPYVYNTTSVAFIPDFVTEREKEPLDSLPRWYDSLLRHTAHMFFLEHTLTEQSRNNELSCYNDPSLVANEIHGQADRMLQALCSIRSLIYTLETWDKEVTYEDSSVRYINNQILSEPVVDLPLTSSTQCIKNLWSDCTVVAGSRFLWNYLKIYVTHESPLDFNKICKSDDSE